MLGEIRKKKSEEQRPLKTAVERAIVRLPEADRALLAGCEPDLRAAGLINEFVVESAEALEVVVQLAPADAAAQEPRV